MRARDRSSLAIGAVALAASVLVIGGALRWTQALVAVLVGLALVMQLGSRRRIDQASPLLALLGIAVALTAIQLIPLPDAVLRAIDARGMELRDDGAALAGTAPWRAISLDPANTLRALAAFVTLLGTALLGLRIASAERGRYLVLAGVAITCGLAAGVTGFHTLLNLDHLYGVYAPQHATPTILGPLLNPNHLGGLMALGAVLALGLAFYARQAAQLRVLWVVIAVGCSATALASQSRGAALALGLGVATAIALLIAARVGRGSGRRHALINDIPITIVVAAGLAIAVYTSAGKVADQLEATSTVELDQPLSKYAAWRSSFALVHEAPALGIGRGAFEPVFTRIHEPSAYVTFSHLENEYIQAVVEWGVPGAIAIGLALGWCVVAAMRRWRDGPLAAAAIGACAAVLFQSSVDFGVELLGVAVPVTLVAATLLGGRLREGRTWPTTIGRAAVMLGLAGAAVVLMLPATRSIQEDHDWLTALRDRSTDAALDDLRPLLERHPLDYLAFGEAAASGVRHGDPRAAKFLNHALTLHPTHPGLHRLAARMLIAGGRRSQGAVEYALALRGTLAPKPLIVEILALLPEAELAATAIPIDAINREQVMRSLLELAREDVAQRWLQRVVAGPQHDLASVDELYRLALKRRDLVAAEQAARRRLAESRTHASQLMLAKVQFRREQFAQVLAELGDVPTWKGRLDEQAEAWFLVCDVHIEQRAWDPALQCLHKLDAAGILPNARRNEVIKRLTIVNEARTSEAKQKAIEEMQRALGSPAKSP